jgi:predicted small metal-binding protein
MKKLNCQDLGGPCDAEFVADSFEEIGNKSRQHVVQQIQAGDESHKLAADKMTKASIDQLKP